MTTLMQHGLELTITRTPYADELGQWQTASDVFIETTSANLVEAWRELVSRLPNDVYVALKEATKEESKNELH